MKRTPMEDSTINLDINFQDELSVPSIISVATELVKILLYQRKQIPEQVDRLRQDASMTIPSETLTSAETFQQRRTLMRKKRLDDRFRQKVASVLDDFDNLVKTLTAEMMSSLDLGSSIFIEEIAIVFGATPLTPKEIYLLHLPPFYWKNTTSSSAKLNQRATQQLFRTLITNEQFFNRMGQSLNVTNTHVAVKIRGVIPGKFSDNLVERPGFLSHKGKSCKMTLLNLNLQLQNIAFKTPARRESARKVSYTPYEMDLCTPTDQRHNLIFVNNTIETTPLFETKNAVEETRLNLVSSNEACWLFIKDFVRGFKDPRLWLKYYAYSHLTSIKQVTVVSSQDENLDFKDWQTIYFFYPFLIKCYRK